MMSLGVRSDIKVSTVMNKKEAQPHCDYRPMSKCIKYAPKMDACLMPVPSGALGAAYNFSSSPWHCWNHQRVQQMGN
jgi:hypothetical protein